jgi:hypothetical protein
VVAGTDVISAVDPLPSCPFTPSPQHFTVPAVRITQVCNPPQATDVTPLAIMLCGVLALVVPPLPSWPLEFRPQQRNPALITAQTCALPHDSTVVVVVLPRLEEGKDEESEVPPVPR